MIFDSAQKARNSLREFSPWMRRKHKIVRFYSTTHGHFRYCRVFVP